MDNKFCSQTIPIRFEKPGFLLTIICHVTDIPSKTCIHDNLSLAKPVQWTLLVRDSKYYINNSGKVVAYLLTPPAPVVKHIIFVCC